MTYEADLKDYERLLAKLSHRETRRAAGLGFHVEFDDLFQEAKVTFLRAQESFDPERGVKFSTYLWRAVRNNLKNFGDVFIVDQMQTTSIDREIGDEDGGTLHDLIAADLETVDERLERMDNASETFRALSDHAKRVVLILDQTPAEMQREIARMEAFRLQCKANGFAAANRVLDVQTVCVALGLSEKQTREVKRELRDIMEQAYGKS